MIPSDSRPIRLDSTARRTADILISGASLVILAPLFAFVGVAIKVESSGPVFFRQERVGAGSRSFRILKFRSMVPGKASAPKVSGRRDPRITKVGAFLRATKIDEFPQLWNVFRGEMTLVGPRAEIPELVAHFTEEERLTLLVRPGLTCPGQLYFTSAQAAELDGISDPETHYIERQLHPKLALDLEYLRERTLPRDFRVVAATIVLLSRALIGRA